MVKDLLDQGVVAVKTRSYNPKHYILPPSEPTLGATKGFKLSGHLLELNLFIYVLEGKSILHSVCWGWAITLDLILASHNQDCWLNKTTVPYAHVLLSFCPVM